MIRQQKTSPHWEPQSSEMSDGHYTSFSAFRQEVVQANPKTRRSRFVFAPLATCDRSGFAQRSEKSLENDEIVRRTANPAGRFPFFDTSRMERTGIVARKCLVHSPTPRLDCRRDLVSGSRRHSKAKTGQADGCRLEDLSPCRKSVRQRPHDPRTGLRLPGRRRPLCRSPRRRKGILCEIAKNERQARTGRIQKTDRAAAEEIESVTPPSPGKTIVLFDRFYLCDKVVRACENKGFTYIGAVKDNRNFFPDGRPNDKKKIGTYGKNVLDRDGRWTSISGSRKEHCVAERVGTMAKLGRIKLAFSRRRGEKSRLTVATNGLRWSTKSLIEHYRNPWPIEILFKMTKQHLGLGDYQFLRYTAVERYLHLVMISHHLLTHLAMERSGAKAQRNGRGELRLPSVERMQAVLRNMLFEDRIKAFSDGPKYEGLARKLKEILVPTE